MDISRLSNIDKVIATLTSLPEVEGTEVYNINIDVSNTKVRIWVHFNEDKRVEYFLGDNTCRFYHWVSKEGWVSQSIQVLKEC